MRIEIKYRNSEGPHLIDLSAEELDQLRGSREILVAQSPSGRKEPSHRG